MTGSSHVATPVTAVATATVLGFLLVGCGGPSDPAEPASDTADAPSIPASASATQAVARTKLCGKTRGPDGELFVHALGTAEVDCAEAMKVADDFGPRISAAKEVTVDGWDCSFPSSPGMLARCDNGDRAIGFFSSH